MKIWIFQTGEFLPIDGEKNLRAMRAINLSKYFLKRGHSVTLLSSNFSHQMKSHRGKKFEVKELTSNFKIALLQSPGYSSNISFKRVLDHIILGINTFKYLINTKPNDYPDFVFIGYPPIETSFFFSIWLKFQKIPFCIDVKDQWPHIFLLKTKGLSRKILKLILLPYFLASKFSLNQATFLTAITPKFLNWSESFSKNYSKKNQPLYLVPGINKVSETKLEECLFWWQNKIGINIKKKNKIIFAGNINNAYDFKDLISAISSPNLSKCDFELLICGEGELLNDLKFELDKKSNVFFPGWVNHSKLLALKTLSIATLAPYRNTFDFQMSIPNKIFDSLYFGLPIITSLEGELEKLIKEYKVGYFCDDIYSWSDQIKRCINDSRTREILSNNAKCLYEKKFTSELVYGEFVKFVEKNFSPHKKVI